jgi:phage tail sheath protein FI
MATPIIVSPGVYSVEVDNSQFAPSIDSSIVGLVGFANKGPTNKATLITSPQRMVDLFGEPDSSLPDQALLGAIEIFETTNSIYFVRAAVAASAISASSVLQVGASPHMQFNASGFGVTQNLYLSIQVTDNAGVNKFITPKQFSIPSGTDTTQVNALVKIIGTGALATAFVGVYPQSVVDTTNGILVGAFAGSSTTLTASAYSDPGFTIGLNAFKLFNPDSTVNNTIYSSVAASGVSYNFSDPTSSFSYKVFSLYPGNGYNLGVNSDGTTSGNSVDVRGQNGNYNIVQVNQNGSLREQFKVRLAGSGTFIEKAISNSPNGTLTSEIIYGYLAQGNTDLNATAPVTFAETFNSFGGGNNILGIGLGVGSASSTTIETKIVSRFLKLVEGTYGLANGRSGIGNSNENIAALIGDVSVTPKTGMQALSDDVLGIDIAAIPGVTDQNVQNALITLAESTQNFIAAMAPPYAVGGVQQAVDWSNGISTARSTAINSSWVAVYWPWVKVFSKYDGIDRWYDPSIFAVRTMTYTDAVAETWFAPAGENRGRLTKPTDVEMNLNQGDRNSLYGAGNIINPVVNFPQDGLMIFGQRTGQRLATALDRINIRRLMIFLRKSVLVAGRSFVFEPNDPFTWAAIKGVIDPLLDDIRRRRGITQYRTICDETTNTPQRIANNQLWCKILIRPTLTAEAIVFELNLTSQSAQF